jgi:Icc-related predicted phosphoesterase
MKILVITDLHGNLPDDLLGFQDVDIVLVLGDITTGAGLTETRKRIEPLKSSYPRLYAVPGNWERPESIEWLDQEGLNIDAKLVRFQGLLIFGLGGSIPTPFNTPNETTEDVFAQKLSTCPEPQKGERLIICSHNPPYGACDKVFLGKHVGSESLRKFIDRRSPDLLLCGHIHEARGQEQIEATIVINPGTAPKHYAFVTIEEEISVTLE